MKIYLVGGAVRDKLLGLPLKEKDWVVVGATSKDMLKRGFRQVGKEFPVFLHPHTHEEYALARKERKTHPGYSGFEFDTSLSVTLEADLERRDLTINAIAETELGELIDPYQGKADLDNKILRHVSPAFAEDPVRILRVGRFLARLAHLGFVVAPETILLMKKIVKNSEINALVPERVWKEWQRAMGEKNPEKFFEVLDATQALPILFPSLAINGAGIKALTVAASLSQDKRVRFAALMHAYSSETAGSEQDLLAICRQYRIPSLYKQLARLVSLHVETALKAPHLSPLSLFELLSNLDVFRREYRFHQFLITCQAIALSRGILFDPLWLMQAAIVVRSVDVQGFLKQGLTGNELADALKAARIEKLKSWLTLSAV